MGINYQTCPAISALRFSSQRPAPLRYAFFAFYLATAASSFLTIGATSCPKISMARNIFGCGNVDTPI
jgi:hypothetical protein